MKLNSNEVSSSNPWSPSSPRPDKSGYVSSPFQVAIDSFKKLFTLNLVTLLKLVGAALAPVVLLMVLWFAYLFGTGDSQTLGSNHPAAIIGSILAIVAIVGLIVWFLIISAAYQWYSVMTARGSQAEFRQSLRVGNNKWLGILVIELLRGLAILAGLLLFLIPGIIFSYWFSLAAFVYVDSELGPIEAMKRSRQLVKGKAAEIFGLVGVSVLINLPTAVPLLGTLYSFISSPVSKLALAYRYTSAQALEESAQPKPATSPANYVAILMLPVLIILFVYAVITTGDQQTNNEAFGYLVNRV